MAAARASDFDKAARSIYISATIGQAVADAYDNTKALQTEGFQVTVNELAGARFLPRGDARILAEYPRCMGKARPPLS